MRTGALALVLAAGLAAKDRIGAIEYFGYKGMDLDLVGRTIPVHVGDPARRETEKAIRKALREALGRDVTDVSGICCNANGDFVIFIGLPGASSREFRYDAAPTGDAPVSRELATLYEKKMETLGAAVRKGESAEDGSPGYGLLKEPRARAAQLAFREYALKHEAEIVHTLQTDRRGEQRAIAAEALGYGARTPRQIAALVRAVRDPEGEVRNNATRALWEILRGDSSAAAEIPAEPFIEMVQSRIWTDRNKGSLVLEQLANSPRVRELARREAGDALAEMAAWKEEGWASSARAILGQ